jgi:Fur family transcriptional regulator, ferric uptake regulator
MAEARASTTHAVEPSGSWVDRTEASLAAAGYRRGGARRAVLELLASQPCALSALEIEHALARDRGGRARRPGGGATSARRRVSRASVYRILDELERLGHVQRLSTGHAMARYERVRDAAGHHHHLVCDGCGNVTPFSDERLERAIAQASDSVPLTVSEHEIVLRGRCRDCA